MASFAKLSVSLLLAFLGLCRAQKQIPFSASSVTSIPSLGFGTWRLDKSNASEAVSVALQAGYRHLDCAAIYGNEKEVAVGIKDGLKTVGLHRSSVWITSKLWNDQYVHHLYQTASWHIPILTHGIILAIRLIRLNKRLTRR